MRYGSRAIPFFCAKLRGMEMKKGLVFAVVLGLVAVMYSSAFAGRTYVNDPMLFKDAEVITLTDGTATLTGGVLSGITSTSSTTVTDGTATMTGGNLTGVGDIDATTGSIDTLDAVSSFMGPALVTTAADTLTAAECGKKIYLNNATGYATALPALSTVSAGCQFDFTVKTALSSGNHTVTTGNSLENKIYGVVTHAGAIAACADEDTITFVVAALPGAWASVVSDGDVWYVTGEAVTTNLLTCTAAD